MPEYAEAQEEINTIQKSINTTEILIVKAILEDGYNIKNRLRLTIGSNKDNINFMKVIKVIFN